MIKWIYKPTGNCPVQAEGWFLGYYFYFRARWDVATIAFSKSPSDWDNNLINATYVLLETKACNAGWLSHKKCKWLIYKGCLKFAFRKNKTKLV